MAVAKVTLNGTTLMDTTDATASADKILNTYTAYIKDGTKAVGTATSSEFVVTLTYNTTSEMWEPDCTYAEAYAAYQAGKRIVSKATDYTASFIVYNEDSGGFIYQVDAGFDDFNGTQVYDWGVDYSVYVWTTDGIEVDTSSRVFDTNTKYVKG